MSTFLPRNDIHEFFPKPVPVSGKTSHCDLASDITVSNVEHVQRGTTHCHRVSDTPWKQEDVEHGYLCKRSSSCGRCPLLDDNAKPLSSLDLVSVLSVHSDWRPWFKCLGGDFVMLSLAELSGKPEPICSLCCRRDGGSGGGAAINSKGCTGACLRWALQNITPHRQPWRVTSSTVAYVRAICSDLNDLGYGYLHWTLVIDPEDGRSMWASDWIALARKHYFTFQRSASAESVKALFPELPAFCQTLDTVHENCRRLPTVVYTLTCEATTDDANRVCIVALNGEVVHDVTIPCKVPWNAWRHLPSPRHRIALNGNLYTWLSYQEREEHMASSPSWAHQPPCYEHCIAFVDANAVYTKLSPEDAVALWTFF